MRISGEEGIVVCGITELAIRHDKGKEAVQRLKRHSVQVQCPRYKSTGVRESIRSLTKSSVCTKATFHACQLGHGCDIETAWQAAVCWGIIDCNHRFMEELSGNR